MQSLNVTISNLKRKLIEMPLPMKASIAYMFVNFMQKGISFMTSPIFTRILTQTEYGQISVYQLWLEILGMIAMFSIYDSVYNNGILEFEKDRDNFTFSLLMFSNFLTLIVFAIVWGVNHLVFRFLNFSDILLIFMFVGFLFEPAYEFWKVQERFAYRYKKVCFCAILVMIGSPILAITSIFLFSNQKVEARLIGGNFVILLIGVVCYVLLVYRSKRKVKLQYWKYAFFYNLPILPYSISTYILNCSDRLMISYMNGDEAAAVYSVAYTAAAMVGIVWTSINSALTPTVYKRCYENRLDTLSDLVLPLQMLYAIFCVAIMGLAPEVISFLAPSSYGEGIYAIPAIIGGTFFNYGFSIFSNIIFAKKKQTYVMFTGIFVAILNLILNFIFIPRFGYLAAGYTTLFSYFIEYIGIFFFMPKIIGEQVYKPGKILLISAFVLVSGIIFPFIYQYVWLRYALLLFLFVIIWKKRKVFLAIPK